MLGPIYTADMNSLDRHIAKSIYWYPTLYHNRTDVLNQLFCTTGNGYEWVDGVLESEGSFEYAMEKPDRNLQDEEEELKKHAYPPNFEISTFTDAYIRTTVRRHNLEVMFCQENAHLLARVPAMTHGSEQPHIYPLCQYAKMLDVPDNVKSDWLAGIREIIFTIFSMKDPKDQRTYVQPHSENIKWADKALADINARFGKPERQAGSYAEYVENQKRM